MGLIFRCARHKKYEGVYNPPLGCAACVAIHKLAIEGSNMRIVGLIRDGEHSIALRRKKK